MKLISIIGLVVVKTPYLRAKNHFFSALVADR
jgi:hypothetical protein